MAVAGQFGNKDDRFVLGNNGPMKGRLAMHGTAHVNVRFSFEQHLNNLGIGGARS